jgi:hypothetical protein
VQPALAPLKRGVKRYRRKLTLEQVYRVLTEVRTPHKTMGIELGVSHQCIQQIRAGATWTDAFPEVPRRAGNPRRTGGKSCKQCCHWTQGECAMGFPDPLEEGPRFAVDCDFYEV